MLLGWSGVLGLGLALGCTRAEAPARSVEPPAASNAGAVDSRAASPTGASAAPLAANLGLTLSRSTVTAPSANPTVEIEAPFAGQHIGAGEGAEFEVHFTVDRRPVRGGDSVEAMLDSFRPRPVVPGEPLRLGWLVPEDSTLAPGTHQLFIVMMRDGVGLRPAQLGVRGPAALVEFSVGEPSEAPGQPQAGPRLVLLRPQGTYNGAEADQVPLDLYLAGAPSHAGATRLSIRGRNGLHTELLDDLGPRTISGLPSGDFEVAAWLVDAEGEPLVGRVARVARTITVNRELGSGEGDPQ